MILPNNRGKDGNWRRRVIQPALIALLAAGLLTLSLLAAGCGAGDGAGRDGELGGNAPAAPDAGINANNNTGAGTDGGLAERENGAGVSSDAAAGNSGGGADSTTVEAEVTASATAPSPTATPSVSELAALVEANPPSATEETDSGAGTDSGKDSGAEPGAESVDGTGDGGGSPSEPAEPERAIAEGPLAAEPTGINAWINSDPLTLAQLRGKVVLVDFWTYTCVNCVRTFPYLKLWHSRYADDGLVILGIHTPEFEFEKDYYNVLESTEANGIVWPVAQDNDFQTWQAYGNRYWPAKYLIDRDGVIRYTHFGEGRYAETEGEIRRLLAEAGADLSDDLELPEDQELDPTFLGTISAEVTPELYAGYYRNFNTIMSGLRPYVTQMTYYENADSVGNFTAPADPEAHLIFFHGPWEVGKESARHARRSENYEDYLTLKYSAKSANAVLTSLSGEPYRVRVTLDGEYLTEENRGADVVIGEDGESYLSVDQPRLYELVDSPAYTQNRVLRLSSNSPDFGLFAFTFGVYREGP